VYRGAGCGRLDKDARGAGGSVTAEELCEAERGYAWRTRPGAGVC
jgi:hypothetical protein